MKKLPKPKQPINPFLVTTGGFKLLFRLGASIGIFLVIVCATMVMSDILLQGNNTTIDTTASRSPIAPSQMIFYALVLFVICLFITVANTMIKGIQAYTVWALSRGQKVTLPEAFNATLERFGWFLVLYMWFYIRVFAWSLLFVVPGIIAYYRYSFAMVLFFDKDLQHEHALRESARLTRGGLMTLFGAQAFFNLATLYQAVPLVEVGSMPTLYRAYVDYDKRGVNKPATHWLSWLGLGLTIAGAIVYLVFVVLLFAAAATVMHQHR